MPNLGCLATTTCCQTWGNCKEETAMGLWCNTLTQAHTLDLWVHPLPPILSRGALSFCFPFPWMEHGSYNYAVSLEPEMQRKATLFRDQNPLAWTLLTSPRFCSSITNRRLREIEHECLPARVTTRRPMGKGRSLQGQLFSPDSSIYPNQFSWPMGLFH